MTLLRRRATDISTHRDTQALAVETLGRARAHLESLQHVEGWWKGELETNVTIEAEDLFLRSFLGVLKQDELRLTANWIRSKQRDDGTWGNFYGAPPDLSTTVEAYVALRLAGDDPSATYMRRASAWILDNGGVEATRVFTRMWLALHAWERWEDLPALPPEAIYLPRWVPLNIYDFGCWVRQTVVALTVVWSYRPQRPSPFSIDEIRTGRAMPLPDRSPWTWSGWFYWLDRALQMYERRPLASLRSAALARAERWILDRQEADGSWGGIQPPWVYSMIALHVRGYGLDHPVMRRAFDGLDRFTIVEDGKRRLEACQSPVWDTALAVTALADAGAPPDDPAIERAATWLLDQEVRHSGDWAVRRPGLEPGAWAFEFANDNYPDVDDAAEVVLALRRAAPTDARRLEAAVRRGVAWTIGMQSSDGGWGAFDIDNTQTLCRAPPFFDFGEVIDPPSADVTAHALEMLAVEGRAHEPPAQRGVAWLLRAQEPDGSWFGRWGGNYVYGTAAVVPALVAAGLSRKNPAIRRAVKWIESRQNADGGWGEDPRSYDHPEWSGRGASTASQTAWALLTLEAAGELSRTFDRGVRYLANTQRQDGTWDEPWYTGTGFPGAFYIKYHLYRLIFPVMALGRYVRAARELDRRDGESVSYLW